MNVRSALLVALLVAPLTACDDGLEDGPPSVRLAHDVCDECNMIISDARWATATIVQGPRGPEPKLFDDFNCQVRYETEHSDLQIHARWSNDHASPEWFETKNATFVLSEGLRTPMGSSIAAFANKPDADAFLAGTPGRAMTFSEAWAALGANGK